MTFPFSIGFPQAAFPVNSGPSITDPRRIPQSQVTASALTIYTSAAGTANSTASTFFSQVGAYGANADTSFTASTYQTIVSISGPSIILFMGAVGPTAGGSETTTFRVTRDGAAYEIPVAVNTGFRACLGAMVQSALYTTADRNIQQFGAYDSSRTVFTYATTIGTLVQSPPLVESLNPPIFVGCETSLVVQIKHSANITATTNMERQCGAMYIKKY